jgi:hypothetical protein
MKTSNKLMKSFQARPEVHRGLEKAKARNVNLSAFLNDAAYAKLVCQGFIITRIIKKKTVCSPSKA